jgi:hypothetical protein
MSRYLEIELTSRAPDGGWTWRAAGARQPRGTLSSDLAPEGASVGTVWRAEVESTLDGIEVSALAAKPQRAQAATERIEVLGTARTGPDISVAYAQGGRRRSGRDQHDRAERTDRGTEGRGPRTARGPRPDAEGGTAGARTGRGGPGGRATRGPAGGRGDQRPQSASRRGAGADRDRRPAITSVHRNAVLAQMPPEHLAIAEQLVRGGIPAVRQAIEEQNARAKADGRPLVAPEPFLAVAEELLPAVNLATWKDRATSAQSAGKETRLRDLRTVVAASRTVGLDEEGRALAKSLQESLEQRTTALQDEWTGRLETALDDNRVLDALRIVARPPEPGTRCSAELAVRLSSAAGAAMNAETPPGEWLELLEAAVAAPVRRTVHPAGIPASEEVHAAALNAAGLVPELAKLLGLRIPPPPPRRAPAKRAPISR